MTRVSRRQFLATTSLGAGSIALGLIACRGEMSGAEDITALTLTEASRRIRARELSPVALTEACLARIALYDGRINSFITVTGERALQDARVAESEIASGKWRGPLHGIPIALKDNIDTAGIRTTAGSQVFEQRVPTDDAAIVQRLRAAGAIILGKLNMHEFALGTTSAISLFGAVHNPWNAEFIAGGSSGGCAAAVAAQFCFGAVGTDTGGSIRVPASCCNIVGLKPTYDLVDTTGIIPASRSFDHAGPMCRTVEDTALMFRAMTDNTNASAYDSANAPPLESLKLGVVTNTKLMCERDVDAEVQQIFDTAVSQLRKFAKWTTNVALPMPAEIGQLIDADLWSYHAAIMKESSALYDARTRALISGGESITQGKADSLRAQLDRHRSQMKGSFTLVDVVVLPTMPTLPIRIADAVQPFDQASCTFEFSLAGLPSLAVPCGFSKSGLPVGMIICGPPLSEPLLFALAARYERATNWHTRSPKL